MTSLAVDLMRAVLGWLFLIYTVVAISHYLLQLFFAHRTYRRQASSEFAEAFPDLPIDIDIIVPSYNEEPDLLDACVRSALAQDHPGRVRVYVVDDGSPNRAALDATYDRLEESGAIIIRSPRNVGKRHAQALALPLCEGQILVTLDSDSVLALDAVRRLTRQFVDPRVGAATGFVDVENRSHNLLTRIQRLRYWMAFNQERAAQTYFRTVMCCSGPLAAYRRKLVKRVLDAYLAQEYGGVACTYGDDRHLTNLILAQGFDTVFDSGAVAYTHVPERMRQFLRQQLRWNKSFYRELVWTVTYLASRPLYTRFDVVCQVSMPLMLTLTASSALVVGLATDPAYLLRYVALIAIAAAIRATYGAVRQRDPAFYLFVVYGFVSAFLLMSVRLVALSTLADARWGTRGPAGAGTSWSGPLARWRAATQTASLAFATASAPIWPEPVVSGGPPRFDGAWRAGLRMEMIGNSHASSSPMTGRPIAIAKPPTFIASFPSANADQPVGPVCAHPARRGARFCRACGVPYAPVTGEISANATGPATPGTIWFALDASGHVDAVAASPATSTVTLAAAATVDAAAQTKRRRRSTVGPQPAGPPAVASAKLVRGRTRPTPTNVTEAAAPLPASMPAPRRSRPRATAEAASVAPMVPRRKPLNSVPAEKAEKQDRSTRTRKVSRSTTGAGKSSTTT